MVCRSLTCGRPNLLLGISVRILTLPVPGITAHIVDAVFSHPVKLFSLSCVGFFIAVLPPTCSMGSCMFLYCLSPLQITSTGQWQIISSAQYLALRKSSTNISGIFVEFNHPPQRFVPIHSPPAMYRPQELESTQMYSQIHIVGV